MTGRRYDREALQGEYTAAGNDMTPLSLAAKAGVSLKLLSRRAELEKWEWVQVFYRLHVGCVQETDTPERTTSAVFDALWTMASQRAFHCKGESQP